MLRVWLATATCVALSTLAFLAPNAEADAGTASSQAIAPFLEDRTIGVVRVDVSRIDADALFDRLQQLGNDAEELPAIREGFNTWRKSFTGAGGRDVYVLFSLADLPMNPPFLVVPLGEGAREDDLVAAFKKRPLERKYPVCEKVGNVLFAGTRAQRERFGNREPASRPEVMAALAASKGAVQAAFTPSEDFRRIVAQAAPTLPRELGGAPISVLTDGIRWASLGATLPPSASVKLTVQSKDAQAAREIEKLWETFRSLLETKAGARPEWASILGPVLTKIRPQVEEGRLTWRLEGKELNDAVDAVAAGTRAAANRMQGLNNLKQMALAMHNYHDTYRSLPARAIFDKQGKALLSWRVAILPFIEQQALYQKFHLDEPWDSEHNKKLLAIMPRIYRAPGQKGPGEKTVYQVVVGKNTVFPEDKAIRLRDITDGTSNTILVVETTEERAVPWTKPEDVEDVAGKGVADLLGKHEARFSVAFADGSVRILPANVDKDILHALFTRNGNERVNPPYP